MLQQEEMQGEVIDVLPQDNRRNVVDRYLKMVPQIFNLTMVPTREQTVSQTHSQEWRF